MKLTKEEIYINLQGKSEAELTELYWFLKNNNQKLARHKLDDFLGYKNHSSYYVLICDALAWSVDDRFDKIEVTIQELKEILQPMGTFTPIAMKCTQEQFDAVKPKLKEIGKIGDLRFAFEHCIYLTNLFRGKENAIGNIASSSMFKRTVYEEWNEEIFLKACGIEVETLQEKAIRLENELNEVKQQIEEENKPKPGDWVYNTDEELFYKKSFNVYNQYENKITNPEIIKLLEQETK